MASTMKGRLLAVVAISLFATALNGATYTAASCNESDVQSAYATEQANPQDGDIIAIPAGTCTWTTAWIISPAVSITIQGAGAISAMAGGASTSGSDLTTIVMASTDSAHDYEIMSFTTTTAKLFRITGIAFSFPNGNNASQNGTIAILGTSQSLRVDHNHFTGYAQHWLDVRGWIYGVLDHNVIDGYLTADNWVAVESAANWNGDSGGIGDASWNDATNFGTNKFLFAEDNRFISHNGVTSYTNDCGRGGRQVFRYNTMVEAVVTQGHGPKGDDQGCRATEVYMNTQTSSGAEIGAFAGVLSGPALIWGNNLDLVKIIYPVYDGRKGDGSSQGNMTPGWSMCQNHDSGTVFQGAVNTNGTAVTWVSGGTFVTNWPNTSVPNVVINGTSYAIASVASSTSMTLATSAGVQTGVVYFVPSKWDGNTDNSGYPCLSQPGRGKGDLLTGAFSNSTRLNSTTGTVTWPHQALDPIYAWGNTNIWPGDNQNAVVGVSPATTNVQANRDYYQQMAVYCFGPLHNSCGENPTGTTLSPGQTLTFTGTAGIGQGMYSARPATCTAGPGGNTPGVGYWATDQNTLYVCNPTNTWTPYYTPYIYPHPLTAGVGTSLNPPTNLTVVSK